MCEFLYIKLSQVYMLKILVPSIGAISFSSELIVNAICQSV